MSTPHAPIARTPGGGFYVQGGYRSGWDGKPVLFERLRVPPRFVPSHKAVGSATIKGKRVSEWIEPDAVHGKSAIFRPKHGRVDTIRLLDDPDAVEEILRLDAEEAALRDRLLAIHHERQAVMAEAWALSESVKVADLKTTQSEVPPS